MKHLIITAHPRKESLTTSITNKFIQGLIEAGHDYELLDLYAENFNPVLHEIDEPDWNNPNKIYSPVVQREMERIKESDVLVFIFPLWWYSMPAIMKGYIDRVWNHGFAYGEGAKLPVKQILWLPLVGAHQKDFEKRNFHTMMEQYCNSALSGFAGIDSQVYFFYNTLGVFTEEDGADAAEMHFDSLLEQAYNLGSTL